MAGPERNRPVMDWRRHAGRRELAAVLLVLLGAATLVSCGTTGAPHAGPEGEAYLRRAAERIDHGVAEWTRARWHWRQALAAAAELLPELRATEEWPRIQALAVDNSGNEGAALARRVAGVLREIADGSPVPPETWFVGVAGVFRDTATRGRRAASLVDPQLESIRAGEGGGGATVDRAVDELVQTVNALQASADHFDAAADMVERAVAILDPNEPAPLFFRISLEAAP